MTSADDEPLGDAATLEAGGPPRPRRPPPTSEDEGGRRPMLPTPTGDAETLEADRPRRLDTSEDEGGRLPMLPTPAGDDDDGLGKRLLKQKLFPRRAGPVKIGRFAVLGRLGGGGMGIVYTCYDDQLDRKVAVKVLRSDVKRDPLLARARLLREAQAMARLAHPNIVTVHEVGAVGDEVFVAMEFVRGASLDVWVEQAPRPWRAVIDAYVQAGRGLAAAHRAGIIHRDFKAQNAIITEDGLVKVLDFGLARATDDPTTETAADRPASAPAGHLTRPLTRTGVVMGTPAYMAPEQHLGEETTAASDQFSFCASLYQSLYGKLPFTATSLEALRQDVLRGTIAAPPAGTQVPAALLKILRRGMAVAPRERYPSMPALIAALERVAGARRRRAVIAAAAGGLAIVAGAAASAWMAPPAAPICPDAQVELAEIWDDARAETVRALVLGSGAPDAAAAWATVEPQLRRWAAQWVAVRNEACRTHAEARQSDHLFDLRTACLDQRRAGFAEVIDVLASSDAAGLAGAVQAVAKLPGLERCSDAEALTAALPPPDEPRAAARVQGLREALARAEALEDAGRYSAGLEVVEGMLPEVTALAYAPLRAEALLRLGSLEMEAGTYDAADAALEQALWTAIEADHAPIAAQASSKRVFLRAARRGQIAPALAELPWAAAHNRRVAGDVELHAEYLNNAGVVHMLAGAEAAARQAFQAAIDLRERHGRGDSFKQIGTLNNLAQVALTNGRSQEAIALLRDLLARSQALLGETHPMCLRFAISLARALAASGRPREARALLEPRMPEFAGGDRAQLLAMALQLFAEGALLERDALEARRRYEAALQACPARSDCADPIVGGLGRALALLGDEAGVRARFAAQLAEIAGTAGEADLRHVKMQVFFGSALGELGRAAEAKSQLEPALARCGESEVSLVCAWARRSLAEVLRRAGEVDAAERLWTRARADYRQLLPAQSRQIADASRELGELALARGEPAAAAEHLREAVSIYEALVEPDYPPLASARLALARAWTGPRAEARALAEQALAVFAAKGEAFASEQTTARTWLEGHP